MNETWVVLNDIHFPYHDNRVLKGVMAFVEDLRPDGIVINGDLLDCANISSFVKDPLSPATLEKEIRLGRKFLEQVHSLAKEVIFLGGNHEDRVRRHIWKHQDVFAPYGQRACGLAIGELNIPNLLRLGELGTTYLPYGESIFLGHLMVTHGNIIRKHSGYSARAAFEATGTSVLVGHTHRLGTHYVSNVSGTHAAYENGCLCNLSPSYIPGIPNWQQGFAVISTDQGGWFCVEQPPILSRKYIIYGGNRIRI